VWITSSIKDRIILTIETFMSYIFSCRPNKFGKIIKDGTHQIKNEMNILKFVSRARFYESAMFNLMNFHQRRLTL